MPFMSQFPLHVDLIASLRRSRSFAKACIGPSLDRIIGMMWRS
ncbi:hypothetical protein [Azospirillum endophyticum]